MGPIPQQTPSLTAAAANLIACRSCHALSRKRPPAGETAMYCARCGARLYSRIPDSVARTWALVLTAAVLYLPANLLPITHTRSFGNVRSDTILSGVMYFIAHGDWPIAVVIFVASVCVPLLKLFALAFLLVSVQRRSVRRRADRTRLYRITEAVGRWSMLDVFVVAILVALVNLGELAKISAGSGAVYFAAVVVTTMFAALTFDPRLIWDRENHNDKR
jgi:paraquat-inducible protein A